MSTTVAFCEILRKEYMSNANRMAPSGDGVKALQELNKSIPVPFYQMSLQEWYAFVSQDQVRMDLFFSLENGGRQRRDNMYVRASLLVQVILSDPMIQEVTFMDGHGRFLFAFVDTILTKSSEEDRLRLLSIRIRVIDIDSNANDWHAQFFPNCVDKINADIYLQQDMYTRENLFYFNFCGIGGKNGFKRFQKFIQSPVFASSSNALMMSMSTRGFQGSGTMSRFGTSIDDFEIEDLTPDQKKFITLLFKRVTALPVLVPLPHVALLDRLNVANLKDVRKLIVELSLDVKANVGGVGKRTLNDIKRDLRDEIIRNGLASRAAHH